MVIFRILDEFEDEMNVSRVQPCGELLNRLLERPRQRILLCQASSIIIDPENVFPDGCNVRFRIFQCLTLITPKAIA